MMNRVTNIDLAVEELRKGNLVALPTETVYGLAANATDEQSVTKIFAAKRRPFFDPLIVHFKDVESILPFVESIPEVAYSLFAQFSPGPLTLLLQKSDRIPGIVTSGLSSVAVRIPNHPDFQRVLNHLDFPLAAPSANVFGYISPTEPAHVVKQFGDEVAYILDGGRCEFGLESTIVDCTLEPVRILRKGAITAEMLAEVLGYTPEETKVSSSQPTAPGNIDVHYAPKKPLYVVEAKDLIAPLPAGSAVMSFGKIPKNPGVFYADLSPNAELLEAAAAFFRTLHQLDEMSSIRQIYTTWFPEKGLGKALNDKLRRAKSSI
jgi:L-threonylcarbamoyladenylate synthase